MKRASKKIVRFNRIEEMASIPSSRRTSSVKDITHQIEEDDVKLNFQEEEMKNIRGKIFLKKVIRKLQGLIAPIKKPPDIT